jgi:hypothetical protein
MSLEVTYINGKRCYSFEKGNRFFFIKGIEYELLGAESIEGDKTWIGVIHRFKKRYPGPDDDKNERWEVSMLTLTNKILADQQNKIIPTR